MKVGIITIHKIINYGSALQAYALQQFLEMHMGNDVEIIDYKFPNSYHRSIRYKGLKRLKMKVHDFKTNLPFVNHAEKKSFRLFWKCFFHLTPLYKDQKALWESHLTYDVYLTGSDQVWNTNTLCGDTVMMLDFAPRGSRKFAYGASFTTTTLDINYTDIFKKYLLQYERIGVREASAINILKDLGCHQSAEVVCDPTLLLTRAEYLPVIEKSRVSIPESPYILVYYLEYAFNPMPVILEVVNKIYKKYGYEVVFIDNAINGFRGKNIIIKGIGPCEFADLFYHAAFVVTSSFHGTAFSLINRKPFYSIAPKSKDSRISDLLKSIGLQSRIAYTDEKFCIDSNQDIYTAEVENAISTLRQKSINFLKKINEHD